MKIEDFVKNFAEQFENTDIALFKPDTRFRELGEWSSIVALTIMSMIDDEYDVQLKGDEMRAATTIQDLFNTVESKLA